MIDAATGSIRIGRLLLNDRRALTDAARLLPEMLGAFERLPFNKRCGADRKFCWAEFDLSDVHAIRATGGGSVNDVILAVLTLALARYIQLHGESVSGRLVRLVCPVNLRQDRGESLGNQLSFFPVALPLDVDDPLGMLQIVTARTVVMKRACAADLLTILANCIGVIPPAVQAVLWKGVSNVRLPLPLFNMICTNIPGSSDPLYCVGRRLLTWYPQVPAGYELGINCAVTTFCGRLTYGLIADAHVAPDVTCLRDFLSSSFQELLLAAKARRPGRRSIA